MAKSGGNKNIKAVVLCWYFSFVVLLVFNDIVDGGAYERPLMGVEGGRNPTGTGLGDCGIK